MKKANTTETSQLAFASNGLKTMLGVGMIAYTVVLMIHAAGRTTGQRPYEPSDVPELCHEEYEAQMSEESSPPFD